MLLTQSTFQSQSYPPHAHEGYSISLVTKGVHHFSVETERLKVQPGEVRIIHPYELHETHRSSWSHFNLSIETAQMEETATRLGLETPALFNRVICGDQTLNSLIKSLYHCTLNQHSLETASLSKNLLEYLLKEHLFIPRHSSEASPSAQMLRAKRYLHAHVMETGLTLDEAAQQAHMSKYHFLRQFKQAFGQTPHQYLQNIRIDCVRTRLRQGVSLSQAAHECGFYDQSHMIKTYRKFYGHTPGTLQHAKAQ